MTAERVGNVFFGAGTGDLAGLDITCQQAATIRAIMDQLPRFDIYSPVYVVKKFELSVPAPADPDPILADAIAAGIIRARRPDVYLEIVTGMIDDAGTMAEIYCRKYRHLAIGPRGGIRDLHPHRTRRVSLFEAMNSSAYSLID